MLSTLGKLFSGQHIDFVFLFFLENRIWHVMHIVFYEDNLHEMSNPVFCKWYLMQMSWYEMSNLVFWKQIRRNITNTSSAALAKRIVRVKMSKNIMNATMPLNVISLKTEYPRANESRLYYEHSELRTRPSSIRQGKNRASASGNVILYGQPKHIFHSCCWHLCRYSRLVGILLYKLLKI